MNDYVVRARWVSMNSPKHRVWMPKTGPYRGLWNVSRSGYWVGAFGAWDRAMRCAGDGLIEW